MPVERQNQQEQVANAEPNATKSTADWASSLTGTRGPNTNNSSAGKEFKEEARGTLYSCWHILMTTYSRTQVVTTSILFTVLHSNTHLLLPVPQGDSAYLVFPLTALQAHVQGHGSQQLWRRCQLHVFQIGQSLIAHVLHLSTCCRQLL